MKFCNLLWKSFSINWKERYYIKLWLL